MLADFRLSVMEQNLGTYGITVHQRGLKVAEHYYRANDRFNVFSVAKTFTSMGVGIAEGLNLFKLGDRVLDFFPEYKNIASEESENITIEDLLQMRSGHKKSFLRTNDIVWDKDADFAKTFFETEIEISNKFIYENASTYILSRIIEKVSGKTLKDFMLPLFFNKIDIGFVNWATCPKGHTLGGFGLYLSTEELSRLGLILLNKGFYNDVEIVPSNYVERAINNKKEAYLEGLPESQYGYSYQIWHNSIKGSFRADGKYGQSILVFPDKEAVVSITGHFEGNQNDILKAIYKDILPKL